ncbi:amidohydrolase family protein [Paremcibacter congregatus]|nr:amidohydrolase [Paremcibacter congregatus]
MSLTSLAPFRGIFIIKQTLLGFIMTVTLPLSVAMAAAPVSVDMIVHGRYVVTMDKTRPVIDNGAVAVRDGVIVAVDTAEKITAAYSAETYVAGDDRILMPGLVNGHTHTAMVLFRGMADDLALMPWLQNYIFPMEGEFVDPDFIETGMQLACMEMIKGGTTSFVDMYFYPDRGADVIEKCGLRAVMAAPSIDFPSPGFTGWDDSFAAAVKFVKERKSKSGRVIPAFAPHAPYTVSAEHLAEVAKVAKELDVPISFHLAEDRAELTQIKERYGSSPVLHVANQGMLDSKLIAAHVVHPTDEEIKLLADHKVGVIHNPTSNLKTAAGVAPIPQMVEAGVVLGLGTDGAASNNDLNMWEEIRLAALLHKGVQYDATLMPAEVVLDMATRGGAEAAQLGDLVGDLVVGKRADMIQVDITGAHMTPLYNVISHLVYAVNSNDVVTTIVDGHVLMQDRVLKTLDGEKVRAKANAIAAKITEALKKKAAAE